MILYKVPLALKRYNPSFTESNFSIILDDIVILTPDELDTIEAYKTASQTGESLTMAAAGSSML